MISYTYRTASKLIIYIHLKTFLCSFTIAYFTVDWVRSSFWNVFWVFQFIYIEYSCCQYYLILKKFLYIGLIK